MKIILVSNLNPNYTNTNVYRVEALRQLGHEVIFFNDRNFILPGRIHKTFPFLYSIDNAYLNYKLIKQATVFRPELCLMCGGYRTSIKTLKTLKTLGSKIALLTTDVPSDFFHILKSAAFYDHIFYSGTEAIEPLHNAGIKNPQWIPFACSPEHHKKVELSKTDKALYEADITFVGAYYPNREQIFEELSDFNIKIWGPNWNKIPLGSKLRIKINSKPITVDQWRKIYSASKIILVIHYQDGKTPSYQASPKLFEALSCGSFVICDEQKDVKTLFTDNIHLKLFSNIADLKNKIKYYLNNDRERNLIAQQGMQFTQSEHTYKIRMQNLINIVNRT
ncbi:MAG: glycosyltransferase [Candidatus Omnitrophica bacterium]|nr:glycosyltransferase [Candidatus Omnitrophota bacterium]